MSTRRRISRACRPCGAKKIKCDGGTPCGPCERKNTQDDCLYGISRRGHFARRILENDSREPVQASLAALPALSLPSPRSFCATNHTNPQGVHQDLNSRPHTMEHDQIRLPPIVLQRNEPINRSLNGLSAEVSKNLFHTYFNCIHPLWPILYKPMYNSFDYTYPSPNIPNVLTVAIFAIASCVHIQLSKQDADKTLVDSPAKPQFYFDHALSLLHVSDEKMLPNVLCPSITNCQTLTILSLQQHGVAEYSRAAILCGLASSMAIELRLHRPHETGDPIQREIRYRLWWNLFVLEKMISCEMRRPVMLRAEETDTPYPSTSEADEFELFSLTIKQDTPNPIHVSGKLRTLSVLVTSIHLSTIMERISREIYGLMSRKVIRDDPIAGEAKRMELWSALQEWESRVEGSPLSVDLSNNLSSVPAVITNHVIMLSGTILLHRPFIARWASIQSNDNPLVAPLKVCLDVARKICDILERYFDLLYGLPCDMVFSIFTAASTFLYHVKQGGGDDNTDSQQRLKMCIRWLSVLEKNWKSAEARQHLSADLSAMPRDVNGAGSIASTSGNSLPHIHALSQQEARIDGQRSMDTSSYNAGSVSITDDWEFLREFGDPSDDFYGLDEELRGLLDGDQDWKL